MTLAEAFPHNGTGSVLVTGPPLSIEQGLDLSMDLRQGKHGFLIGSS
ncbi:MAG: hypothetical protein HWD81_02235 [Marivivens sp.]|nr:hypothetical protein [Marivivens sp.]